MTDDDPNSTVEQRTEIDWAAPSDDSGKLFEASASRRGLLAALGLTGSVGLAGCQFLESDEESADESQSPSRTDDGSGEELLLSQEVEIRAQQHADTASLVPSFDYWRVFEEFSDDDAAVKRIEAEPATNLEGDRLVIVAAPETVRSLGAVMVGQWADPDDQRPHEVTVDEESVTFEIYTGTEISLGIAIQAASAGGDSEELLMARGYDTETVEELIETFEEFWES